MATREFTAGLALGLSMFVMVVVFGLPGTNSSDITECGDENEFVVWVTDSHIIVDGLNAELLQEEGSRWFIEVESGFTEVEVFDSNQGTASLEIPDYLPETFNVVINDVWDPFWGEELAACTVHRAA